MEVISEIESPLWDDWHVVAESEHVVRCGRYVTTLLGTTIVIKNDDVTGQITARRGAGTSVLAQVKYGFIWVCLGIPTRDIVEFKECLDTDRWVVRAGAIAVAVSGLRVVENFLDMGHFAFVHAGYLGVEPYTEVKKYKVESRAHAGIIATECKFYQPLASPVAVKGSDVDYVYFVHRPYITVLQKANPVEPSRQDMIMLFVQPVSEESCIAHMLLAYLRHGLGVGDLRRYAQFIFSQDKPILENQFPKRLPLNSHAEIHVRADASSAAYRRWLQESGIRFGAISAI